MDHLSPTETFALQNVLQRLLPIVFRIPLGCGNGSSGANKNPQKFWAKPFKIMIGCEGLKVKNKFYVINLSTSAG